MLIECVRCFKEVKYSGDEEDIICPNCCRSFEQATPAYIECTYFDDDNY